MYKPLPNSLTIKTSKVNGLGLFAQEAIPKATNLGTTHLELGQKIIRTPLGGFINHAYDSNCIKVELLMSSYDDPAVKVDYKKWNLITIKDIEPGEEITLTYTFYKV